MEEKRISILINSIFYFLHWVIIIEEDQQFRLVVIIGKEIILDYTYNSTRAARIAFSRYFKNYYYKDGPRVNEWSHFYTPDNTWLKDKLGRNRNDRFDTGKS